MLIAVFALIFFSACGNKAVTENHQKKVITDSIPKSNGPINDFEHIFSPEENYTLLHLVGDFETQTGIEIGIATFDSRFVSSERFNDFTLEVGNKWGVGKKGENNGIFIAFSKAHRQIRINNGYGIEKLISNEETKEIMDKFFITNFKKGEYFNGTYIGTKELMKLLKSKLKK